MLSLAFKQISEAYGVPPYDYPGVQSEETNCLPCARIKRDLYKSQLGGEAITGNTKYFLYKSSAFIYGLLFESNKLFTVYPHLLGNAF